VIVTLFCFALIRADGCIAGHRMAVCSAAHCHNTSRKGFVMVRFPKDVNMRERWLVSLRRPDWKPNDNSRLCEVILSSFTTSLRYSRGVCFS